MKAAVSALGIDPARLTIIVSQLVTLKRGDETVRASKRSGEIVTLRELLEEAGSDACRFFFLSRTPESQMDFDLELAKKESADNPVYYVQYAHARIAGIMALSKERNSGPHLRRRQSAEPRSGDGVDQEDGSIAGAGAAHG